ncbi:16671_t:CDS:2, partial [Entrophospora sp. SA101]
VLALGDRRIKCEGCANRIKNYFDQKSNIIDSKVFFNNQTAIIEVWPVGSYNNNNSGGGEIFKSWVKMIDFQYEPIILQQYIMKKKL